MTVSHEVDLRKGKRKRHRNVSARRKELAYAKYVKKNKSKNRCKRLANERYSELSLSVSEHMNGFQESGDQMDNPGEAQTHETVAENTTPSNACVDNSDAQSTQTDDPTTDPLPTTNFNAQPVPTLAKRRITWSNRRYKNLEMYPHMLGENPNRKPTATELEHAEQSVERFKFFDSGRVVLLDRKKKSKIIAVIEFTPLEELTPDEREDLNAVTSFLQRAKAFVNPVSSSSRCWGGRMFAIGWRKCMEAFELIGRYRNKEAIQKDPEAYDSTMRSSSTASKVLGRMFEKLANVAFEDNQELMRRNHIPGFASLEFDAPLNKDDCAPNLTFTENGFFNRPHKDGKDISDFALAVFVPVMKDTGRLVDSSKDYHVGGGRFVFPDYGCGIDFKKKGLVKMVWRAREYRHCTLPCTDTLHHTRLAMSLQINKKTGTTSKAVADQSILDRPANKNKDKDAMFIGGHEYLTRPVEPDCDLSTSAAK